MGQRFCQSGRGGVSKRAHSTQREDHFLEDFDVLLVKGPSQCRESGFGIRTDDRERLGRIVSDRSISVFEGLSECIGGGAGLHLRIDSTKARIDVERENWLQVSGVVILTVAQFWRFVAIDRSLDEFVNWVRGHLTTNGFFKRLRPSARASFARASRRFSG
jgi:hypothetical protein